jgi:DNA-directed RNA polymerase subunit omega
VREATPKEIDKDLTNTTLEAASVTTEETIPNRYSLVVLAAKRAKQLKEGAPPLIDTESTNLLTIALEEIAAGKITYIEHLETPDDEVATDVRIPVVPQSAQASAMQMLTESLAQSEAELLADVTEEELLGEDSLEPDPLELSITEDAVTTATEDE